MTRCGFRAMIQASVLFLDQSTQRFCFLIQTNQAQEKSIVVVFTAKERLADGRLRLQFAGWFLCENSKGG